jgi:hypothetical protein
MRALSSTLLFLTAAALPFGNAAAQRVLGPGDDAYTLPRGTVRTTLSGDHGIHRDRWNDGVLESLGAGFGTLQFGSAQSAAVFALNAELAILGVNGLNASLGATRLDLRQRVFTTRFGVEVGVLDWLTVGVDAPFVRTRAEAALRLRGDSGLATAGLNPIHYGTGVAGTNTATIQAYVQAATSLGSRRDDCVANAAAHPECPEILAEAAEVDALIALSTGFAAGLTRTYGTGGASLGLPFVPMAGSPGETALLGRVDSLRTAFTRYGVTEITPTTGLPLGAQTPLTAAQLAAMVGTGFAGAGGYGARPMTRTARQQIGDVDLTLRARLFDSFARIPAEGPVPSRFGVRQTVGVTFRLGTGFPDVPDNLIDLGTGSGVNAVALRSFTDIAFNDRLWATVTVGVARAGPHSRRLRVPSQPGIEWLEEWRTRNVNITPASVLEVGVAPRWHLSDYLTVGGEWRWRAKGEDAHEVVGVVAPLAFTYPFLLNAAALDADSDWDEQRLAWTVSYSTLAAFSRGRIGLPFEVGFTHEQSVASGAGIIPRRWTDRLQVRYYARFRGR